MLHAATPPVSAAVQLRAAYSSGPFSVSSTLCTLKSFTQAKAAGIKIGVSSSKELAMSLEAAQAPAGHQYFNTLLRMLVCQLQWLKVSPGGECHDRPRAA